jgi:5-methylcytosine-specific restriction endonuclease McrA
MGRSNYTIVDLEEAIRTSKCWREVLEKLNSSLHYRGSQSHIKQKAQKLNLDFSHFIGIAHRNRKCGPKRPIEDYYLSTTVSSDYLKKRLLDENIKEYKCEICAFREWLTQPIPLELHHIDADATNNRLNNLQILCSNCHSLVHKNLINKLKIVKQVDKKEKKLLLRKPKVYKEMRVTKEKLEKLIMEFPMTTIGKMFQVSDNAVRKWCKRYKLEMPNMRGVWQKRKSKETNNEETSDIALGS